MGELLVALPDYYTEVEWRLQASDWMVHNFHSSDLDELYNTANYLHNREFKGTEYRASIDLNILQYAVNCAKKRQTKDVYQHACAMLLFCRFAEFQIEPSLAVYERVNYGNGDLEEALDNLAILRALDNADPDLLADYMMGNPHALESLMPLAIDRDKIRNDLTRYHKLTDWDSIYLLVLGAVRTYLDTAVPPVKRFEHYLDWMLRGFRLSLPCLVYAGRLFGTSQLPKMMKYRSTESIAERRNALANMTWDLFVIDHYFKNWINPNRHWEEVLFTQDKVLRDLLRLAVKIQYAEDIDPLLEHLRVDEAAICRELLENRDKRSDRVYGTDAWTPEHRASMIADLEACLGVDGA
jgi:hypothetical protein